MPHVHADDTQENGVNPQTVQVRTLNTVFSQRQKSDLGEERLVVAARQEKYRKVAVQV